MGLYQQRNEHGGNKKKYNIETPNKVAPPSMPTHKPASADMKLKKRVNTYTKIKNSSLIS